MNHKISSLEKQIEQMRRDSTAAMLDAILQSKQDIINEQQQELFITQKAFILACEVLEECTTCPAVNGGVVWAECENCEDRKQCWQKFLLEKSSKS